jgi:DNA-directed RNA polymerase subunit alpha
VLRVYPNHARARLFLRDAAASTSQFYDEDAERRSDRYNAVLDIPVTDFELSVRSRNCLKKMNIFTLGDLTRCTEQQLLASKNFGETSLLEVKQILSMKGLRLGQALEEPKKRTSHSVNAEEYSPQEQALLSKPVAELNLSVRSRKCVNRLGIGTIGELISHTGDELLECKNFGVTSLVEVREKLKELGLKLRGD